MNIGELAIRKGTLTWTLSVTILILGWLALQDLPRLEEPELSIREAWVITPYPGASAAEVEQEVSDKIEKAVQELGQLLRVESYSSRGRSVVSVLVEDQHDKHRLPQIWDALRRKINDVQSELPPGAGPSTVDDDGDVYGVYFALVGEGFTEAELKRVAERVQRALSSLQGVRKVILFGEQREAIFVEISRARTRDLGVGLEQVFEALGNKNVPVDAGRIRVGPEHVPIDPSGLYRTEQDLGDLMIAAGPERLLRLGDIAEIRRDYEDPPRHLLRIDGRPAIGVAVSTGPSGNLVATASAVGRRLAELTAQIPLGMELKVIASQSDTLANTTGNFRVYLIQAAVMIIAMLLLVMGLRGGLIIAFVTLLTMAGTFVAMDYFQIALERISLGALLIALGLIPGNAILVVDDMKLRIDRGMTGIAAAREVVAHNALPLLGATAVAVLAFAPIAGMDNSAGEYTCPLYLVVLISLTISWVTAVTTAPLLADRFLRSRAFGGKQEDPYGGRIYRLYARTLVAAMRRRWIVLGATALLLALSLYGIGFVKKIHFPPSTMPTFLVEVYFREGTHIRETERWMDEIQAYLRDHAGVAQVAAAIGVGHPRHLAISNRAPDMGGHYAVSLVSVDEKVWIDASRFQIQAELGERFPDAVVNVKRYVLASDTAGGRLQLRISGPDPSELRRIADRVKALIAADADAKAVRDDWGAKVKIARPVLARESARRLRIDRAQVSTALRTIYSGTHMGSYREGAELIPIVVRAPKEERSKVEDMADVPVTSPLRGDKVSMRQLVVRLNTLTEDARRSRRDRIPTITVHADADRGQTFELLERIKPHVEKALDVDLTAYLGRDPGPDFEMGFDRFRIVQGARIPLRGRPGYFISWGGEAARLSESRAKLGAWIPIYFGLSVLVTVALFNALRQPLIILLTAPLSMIGVTAGLLLTGQPFGFMSLLGVMGLWGMLIKNAIVLVDRIDLEIRTGKARLTAILDAAHSSLRPVGLAVSTGILAMLPLLRDDVFLSMAVTIVSGLALAGLLTLVVAPVLYATLFGIRSCETG